VEAKALLDELERMRGGAGAVRLIWTMIWSRLNRNGSTIERI
jgi:hypothetical protein